MAEKSVGQLAETLSVTVDRLLQQMQEAGLPQSTRDDMVTDNNQQELLAYLKRSHGESDNVPKKITLKRRTTSTLKTSGGGRGRIVPVEVRKKRTYVRRSAAEVEEAEPLSINSSSSDINKISEDESRRRAAHAEAEACLLYTSPSPRDRG